MTTLLARQIPGQDWRQQAGSRSSNGPALLGASTERECWLAIFRQIESLRGLSDNWDGLGATAPPKELVDSAVGLANLLQGRGLEAPSRVVPATAGTVVLEWQDWDGMYCEVEIDRPFHAEVMLIQPGQPAQHWELPDL